MVIPKSSGIMFELATVINNPKNKNPEQITYPARLTLILVPNNLKDHLASIISIFNFPRIKHQPCRIHPSIGSTPLNSFDFFLSLCTTKKQKAIAENRKTQNPVPTPKEPM